MKKLQAQGDFWSSISILSVISGIILLILSFPSLAFGNLGLLVLSGGGFLFVLSIVSYLFSHIIFMRLDILSQGK